MADLSQVRELLFADLPLSEWIPRAAAPATGEPWTQVEQARVALDQGDAAAAVLALRTLTQQAEVESRVLLQAWHSLRQLGVTPDPQQAKTVLGVVLEVHLEDGLDTLAAYQDGSARYLNHGGRMVVWEAEDDQISSLIDDLLREGQTVADVLGPWEEARRPPPPKHHVRINMLTASGLHFGEGPFDALSADPMGGPVINAGAALMMALIERAEQAPA